MRCFDWITDELAIGGRYGPPEVVRFAEEDEIAAVVDLRAECRDDSMLLKRHGIAFLHLPTRDTRAVSQRALAIGVRFAGSVMDGGGRVLVHCEHGIGRSATLGLCILVDRGLTPMEALERAKAARPRVSPSPAQYEAWARWLTRRKAEREASWAVPDFDAFARIAYRHLSEPALR